MLRRVRVGRVMSIWAPGPRGRPWTASSQALALTVKDWEVQRTTVFSSVLLLPHF